MATRSIIRNHHGYCKVDKGISYIGIQYISNPTMGNRFIKARNRCFYLDNNKCSLDNECPIYKDAPAEVEADKSNLTDEY